MKKITKKQALVIGGGMIGAKLLYKILKKKFNKERPKLYIDFDGTICDDEFPSVGKLKEGADVQIRRLIKTFDIIIHSCRTSPHWKKYFKDHDSKEHKKIMENFLRKHEIPYTKIDLQYKPYYFRAIDDRTEKFEDNWKQIADKVLEDWKNECKFK